MNWFCLQVVNFIQHTMRIMCACIIFARVHVSEPLFWLSYFPASHAQQLRIIPSFLLQVGQMLMFGHAKSNNRALPLATQLLEILRNARITSACKRARSNPAPLVVVQSGAPERRVLAAAGLEVGNGQNDHMVETDCSCIRSGSRLWADLTKPCHITANTETLIHVDVSFSRVERSWCG